MASTTDGRDPTSRMSADQKTSPFRALSHGHAVTPSQATNAPTSGTPDGTRSSRLTNSRHHHHALEPAINNHNPPRRMASAHLAVVTPVSSINLSTEAAEAVAPLGVYWP